MPRNGRPCMDTHVGLPQMLRQSFEIQSSFKIGLIYNPGSTDNFLWEGVKGGNYGDGDMGPLLASRRLPRPRAVPSVPLSPHADAQKPLFGGVIWLQPEPLCGRELFPPRNGRPSLAACGGEGRVPLSPTVCEMAVVKGLCPKPQDLILCSRDKHGCTEVCMCQHSHFKSLQARVVSVCFT